MGGKSGKMAKNQKNPYLLEKLHIQREEEKIKREYLKK